MFLTLIVLTGLLGLGAIACAYCKTRDPFHPIILTVPMFLFLYVCLPLKLLYDGHLEDFLTAQELEIVQFINLLGLLSYCLGGLKACLRQHLCAPVSSDIPSELLKRISFGGIVLGSIGIAAYVITINNSGGLFDAYGQPYSGGWSDFGYLRDAVMLCIPAIVFSFIARVTQKASGFDIAGLFFSALFAAPFLIHGILGARRGPIFLVLAAGILSWYVMRNRRPHLLSLLGAGLSTALFLLFLVSNRESFYLGSDWKFEESPFQYLQAGTGNEYIYGSGSILYALLTGDYYWGRRYFAILFIRPIPRQLWPDKYEAVGVGEIEENLGTGGKAFLSKLGWSGASGAAPGLIADMWIETWWFALVVLYGIGLAYGRAWYAACTKGGFCTVIYVLMASLTIFLVFQTLEAMLVRFLFMAIPAWFVWRWATAKQGAPSPENSRFQPPNTPRRK